MVSIFWLVQWIQASAFMPVQRVSLLVRAVQFAPCADNLGYPVATLPVGQLRYNGRPFGAVAIAKGDDEESLLRLQAAYEAACKPRPLPDL